MKRHKASKVTDSDSQTMILTVILEFDEEGQLLVNRGCGAVDVKFAFSGSKARPARLATSGTWDGIPLHNKGLWNCVSSKPLESSIDYLKSLAFSLFPLCSSQVLPTLG